MPHSFLPPLPIFARFPLELGRPLRTLLAAGVISLSLVFSGTAIAGPATELVEKFHDVLIDVMKKAEASQARSLGV